MSSEGERLATLEEQSKQAQNQRDAIHGELEVQRDDIRAIRRDVHEIKENLSGMKGFWAGAVAAVSLMAGLIGAAAMALWDKITGGQ